MTLPVTDAEILPAPRVPRYGPLAIGAFVALVVCSNVAAATWAALDNEHPARLLLLSARNRFLVVTVPSGISPFTWSLLAFIRLGASAVVCHLVGRAYGDRALRWFWKFMGMPQEQVAKFEKAFANAEWVLVPFFVGSNIVWVLSGAAKTTWKRLVPLFAVGLAARLALLWWLSKQFEDEVRSAMRWVDRYQWWVIGISIAIVVMVNVRNLRSSR
ncbi:hypothetical protein BH10ACT2_BH10ACT2_15970 [soil metagenome]